MRHHDGAGGGIRTHTDVLLKDVPLPLGYAGSRGQLTGGPAAPGERRVRDRAAAPLPSAAVSLILPTAQANASINPTYEIFNRLLRERIIFLGTEVDDDLANVICAQLLHLAGDESEEDVWLYINSPGGSVTAGMAIYDTMQFIEPDVATVCMGLGASMGQFLLCAGAKGKRYALPHARIMMHQPLGGFRGQATDIAIQAEQLMYVKQLMAERIAFHTGQTVDQISADSERDRWFTAEQAKEYGIIDNVIVKRGEML
jgi:ATP-dependent Clp protease, protease subunit